jgi:serine/threonine protein kinase
MQSGRSLSEPAVKKIVRQVALALAHLHARDIVHRDLKLENILVVNEASWQVKLADFGSAVQAAGGRRTICGTLEYLAPEVANREEYGSPVDIWCLGVLMFELLHRRIPFGAQDLPSLRKALQTTTLELDPSLTPACTQLLYSLLERQAVSRPTATEVLAHEWLAGPQ